MTIKEKIIKIMSLALEINPPEVERIGKKRTAVFINWYPHCNGLDIRIYYAGWRLHTLPDKAFDIHTDEENAHEKLDEVIEILEKIKEELCG